MSDEPTTAATADETPQKQYGIAWGDEIDETRKQELWARLRAWWEETDHGERVGPFAGEKLTGAEVFWLAVCAAAGPGNSDLNEAEAQLRVPKLPTTLRAAPNLRDLFLQRVDLELAYLDAADFGFANFEGANLDGAHLTRADLFGANLKQASLDGACLHMANLDYTQLQGADLGATDLTGANLSRAELGATTLFEMAHLCPSQRNWWWFLHSYQYTTAPALGDIRWNGIGTVDLTQIVDWDRVRRLGDENGVFGRGSVYDHQKIVRAYRQVATQLRAQGITEVADRLSHRALSYERRVFLRQGNIPRYLGSWLLAILAGYGYRPLYTIFWYIVVVLGFAFAYWHFGPSEGIPFSPLGALVLSVTSFHGRGFFPGGSPGHSLTLDDPITVLAAAEAVVGLLIEISFIATFTQRFFGAK